ncbi:2-oxoglutarate and iron-dependent oxygenase domain-containing protein 3 isoform X2 [Mastacembelus armatus]|uniref:2-oxoglutarate and iron-dependent oxygenase domain-containing protein 3 isoform X2 n=1 Tax=Mastacembelus armatus TaxID=205130 RepID=UPI000E456C2C|nr:2-oxoglutarate and iron-dependent oxygenase domain-containing protein 3 isoform X2 [Mastacembelus armatus]
MAQVRIRKTKGSNATEIEKKIKRGNALRQGSPWRGYRGVMALLIALTVCGVAVWLYVTSLDSDITETLVSQAELVSPHPRFYTVQCSEDYDNYKRYPGCTPQICGRAVTDRVVTREEAQVLRRLAERGLALAGSEGGASILDLHSGALSMGKQFVNVYRYFGDEIQNLFTQEDFQLYRDVRERIQAVIAETFGLDPTLMYLTKPTFFSRINSTAPKTQHDEYWHPHIDKSTSAELQLVGSHPDSILYDTLMNLENSFSFSDGSCPGAKATKHPQIVMLPPLYFILEIMWTGT